MTRCKECGAPPWAQCDRCYYSRDRSVPGGQWVLLAVVLLGAAGMLAAALWK